MRFSSRLKQLVSVEPPHQSDPYNDAYFNNNTIPVNDDNQSSTSEESVISDELEDFKDVLRYMSRNEHAIEFSEHCIN